MSRPGVVWVRRGNWAAHALVDGKALCRTYGSFGFHPNAAPEEPCALGPNGLPYGKTCQICQGRAAARGKEAT